MVRKWCFCARESFETKGSQGRGFVHFLGAMAPKACHGLSQHKYRTLNVLGLIPRKSKIKKSLSRPGCQMVLFAQLRVFLLYTCPLCIVSRQMLSSSPTYQACCLYMHYFFLLHDVLCFQCSFFLRWCCKFETVKQAIVAELLLSCTFAVLIFAMQMRCHQLFALHAT